MDVFSLWKLVRAVWSVSVASLSLPGRSSTPSAPRWKERERERGKEGRRESGGVLLEEKAVPSVSRGVDGGRGVPSL